MAKEGRLFKDDVARIARVTRDGEGSPWASVLVGRSRVGRVPFAKAEALGVVAGAEWSRALEALVRYAAAVQKAKLKAVSLLKVRARSVAEVRERLARSGFEAMVVDGAIEELKKQRLLDDSALARELAEKDSARGRSARLIEQRLAAKGLGGHAGGGEHARAVAAARNRLAKLPESLGAVARYGRVLAALARLGYEEDVARAVVAEVLGEPPE